MLRESSVAQIRAAKAGYIVVSFLYCALGLCMLLRPAFSARFLFYAIGVLLLLFGVIRIVGYFARDLYRLAFQYDLAFGVLSLVLGLVICFLPGKALSAFYLAVGILILADGLFRIQIAVDARQFGIRLWWLILLCAVAACISGALLILQPVKSAEVLVALLGAALFLDGILNLCIAFSAVKISHVLNEEHAPR